MKTLKLTGLACYAGPRVNNRIVHNGDVVEVEDHHAEVMLQGQEWRADGYHPHWTEVPSKEPVVETKTYEDGVTATGTAPLPDVSPEADAQPQEQPKVADSEAAPSKPKGQRVRRNA